MPNQAVYMALIGGYEELLEQPVAKDSSIPFICLTDNPELRSDTWTVEVVDRAFCGDLVRSARRLKILGHPVLDRFDETLWIDNTVLLKAPPEEILTSWLADHQMAVPRHSYRASVIAEVEAVIDAGRDDPARLYEQLLTYLRHHPEVMHQPPMWTGMMARRNTGAVRSAMQTWWDHVARYSRRDQISFPVAAQPLDLNVIEIDNKSSDVHRWPRALKRVQTSAGSIVDTLRPDVSELGRVQNEIDLLTMDSIGAVNQRELRIAELQAQVEEIENLRRECNSLRLHAASVQRMVEENHEREAELRDGIAKLNAELDKLHSSTSWRVSAPVRAVGQLVRRFR